jgi:Fur family transcriptional regulator, ferric uptake regulator
MSNDVRALHDALRQTGHRLTPQRTLILSIMVNLGGHLSAEEIHEHARRDYPYLNLSTVYRTMDVLKDVGIVAETDMGGGRRHFELLGAEEHHHLICESCGATIQIDGSVLQPLSDRLVSEYGFKARLDHFAIFGICRECR